MTKLHREDVRRVGHRLGKILELRIKTSVEKAYYCNYISPNAARNGGGMSTSDLYEILWRELKTLDVAIPCGGCGGNEDIQTVSYQISYRPVMYGAVLHRCSECRRQTFGKWKYATVNIEHPRCSKCHGNGRVVEWRGHSGRYILVCDRCGGSG